MNSESTPIHFDATGGGISQIRGVFPLFLLVAIGGLVASLVWRNWDQLFPPIRTPSTRTWCKNQLKQLGLALHSYHEDYGEFPPAFTIDASGRPLHSWRVLLLPYYEQKPLYEMIDLAQPWDSPHNSQFHAMMPACLSCPLEKNAQPGTTNYVAIVGEHTVLRRGRSVCLDDITDGTSNTIALGEIAGANIPWMKPTDINFNDFAKIGDPGGFSSRHVAGAHVLLVDGTARFLSAVTSQDLLQALMTVDGDEPTPDF